LLHILHTAAILVTNLWPGSVPRWYFTRTAAHADGHPLSITESWTESGGSEYLRSADRSLGVVRHVCFEAIVLAELIIKTQDKNRHCTVHSARYGAS